MSRLLLAPLCALLATLTLLVAPSAAKDLGWVDVFWLTDRVDATPYPNPYSLELEIGVFDTAGLARVEVLTPAGGVGNFDLVDAGNGEYTLPPSLSGGYPSSAALFADFPAGDWTFLFRDGSNAIIDSVTLSLGSPAVSDFIDITNPSHEGTMPTNGTLEWVDCSACDGTTMVGIVFDSLNDEDVDEFVTNDLSQTSWSPTGLVDGRDYFLEMILGNYSHIFSARSTTGADDFELLSGFESLNVVEVTALPEPGAAAGLAMGVGFVAGLARRRRR